MSLVAVLAMLSASLLAGLTLAGGPLAVALTSAPTPSATPTQEPEGCQRPPDDYARHTVNGVLLNGRTLAMLDHAQALHGGSLDLRRAITQGSYTDGRLAASFGTHDGGGVVDLSARNQLNRRLLTDVEIASLFHALRLAGFAAYLRRPGDYIYDWPLHIHAIAIGDQELSPAAAAQLDGPAGYFRGYDGLPRDGKPRPDRHGGPLLCRWMLELGYRDRRGEALRQWPADPPPPSDRRPGPRPLKASSHLATSKVSSVVNCCIIRVRGTLEVSRA